MPGRVGKQCRERWLNHLNPDINHKPFTAQEDDAILKLVAELGTKWSLIAQRMTGRTESQLKNRYHSSLKDAVLGSPRPKRQRTHHNNHTSHHSNHQHSQFNNTSTNNNTIVVHGDAQRKGFICSLEDLVGEDPDDEADDLCEIRRNANGFAVEKLAPKEKEKAQALIDSLLSLLPASLLRMSDTNDSPQLQVVLSVIDFIELAHQRLSQAQIANINVSAVSSSSTANLPPSSGQAVPVITTTSTNEPNAQIKDENNTTNNNQPQPSRHHQHQFQPSPQQHQLHPAPQHPQHGKPQVEALKISSEIAALIASQLDHWPPTLERNCAAGLAAEFAATWDKNC